MPSFFSLVSVSRSLSLCIILLGEKALQYQAQADGPPPWTGPVQDQVTSCQSPPSLDSPITLLALNSQLSTSLFPEGGLCLLHYVLKLPKEENYYYLFLCPRIKRYMESRYVLLFSLSVIALIGDSKDSQGQTVSSLYFKHFQWKTPNIHKIKRLV